VAGKNLEGEQVFQGRKRGGGMYGDTTMQIRKSPKDNQKRAGPRALRGRRARNIQHKRKKAKKRIEGKGCLQKYHLRSGGKGSVWGTEEGELYRR